MDGKIAAAVHQRPVELFYKEAFSSHLVQCPVKNDISGGLHGQKLHIQRRMVSLDEIQHHLGLDHRQAAFPASDDNFILHTFFPTLLYILQKFPDRPYP